MYHSETIEKAKQKLESALGELQEFNLDFEKNLNDFHSKIDEIIDDCVSKINDKTETNAKLENNVRDIDEQVKKIELTVIEKIKSLQEVEEKVQGLENRFFKDKEDSVDVIIEDLKQQRKNYQLAKDAAAIYLCIGKITFPESDPASLKLLKDNQSISIPYPNSNSENLPDYIWGHL